MAKKVFIFSPYSIFPVLQANHKDIYGHILLFKDLGYQVTLLYYENNQDHSSALLSKLESAQQIRIVALPFGKAAVDNIYTKWYQASMHLAPAALRLIEQELREQKPDIIFFEYSRFAFLAKILRKYKIRIVSRPHNFELMHHFDKAYFNHRAKHARRKKIQFFKNEYRALLSIYKNERLMFKSSDAVLPISYGDRSSFSKLYGLKKQNILYPYLPSKTTVSVTKHPILNVIYLGSNFSSNVNKSGADFLLEKIIPTVNQNYANRFHFHIIGKDSNKYLNSDIENVSIHGFVADLAVFMTEMDIACLPVKIGRGCKIKMFESLQMGLPTIGFKETFYGIPHKEGAYIVAKNTKEYYAALVHLLDFATRKEYSERAKEHIMSIANKKRSLAVLKQALDYTN